MCQDFFINLAHIRRRCFPSWIRTITMLLFESKQKLVGAGRLRLPVPALILCIAFCCVAGLPALLAQNRGKAAPETNYDSLVANGNQLLKEGKLKEAYECSLSAAEQDPRRFEAYALSAFVFDKQGSFAKAKDILDKALSCAPADKRDALLKFKQ